MWHSNVVWVRRIALHQQSDHTGAARIGGACHPLT
jgi:hypothetical protein